MITSKGFYNTRLVVVGMCYTAIVGALHADEVSSRFERAYQQWEIQRMAPEISFRSDMAMYTLPAYKEIVAMGFPALSHVIDKMGVDPMVAQAVFDITKKRPTREERRNLDHHDYKRDYLRRWWARADTEASERVAHHAGKFRNAKRNGMISEATSEYGELMAIGRTAYPHLFARIAEGDTELIPIVSDLTGGDILPTATPEECAAWWQANKQKWSLPSK